MTPFRKLAMATLIGIATFLAMPAGARADEPSGPMDIVEDLS